MRGAGERPRRSRSSRVRILLAPQPERGRWRSPRSALTATARNPPTPCSTNYASRFRATLTSCSARPTSSAERWAPWAHATAQPHHRPAPHRQPPPSALARPRPPAPRPVSPRGDARAPAAPLPALHRRRPSRPPLAPGSHRRAHGPGRDQDRRPLGALRRRRDDRRRGRDRDRAGPRERQHHAFKARQERRGDEGRSRLPARRPDTAGAPADAAASEQSAG